jgi:nitrite reductase/ring-hydroxylating ferredoxin subunit
MTDTCDEAGIRVCASDELADGGSGVRFPVAASGRAANGFAIRFQGEVHAFLNRCTHAYIELDWQRGKFFDRSGLYLMCATHGAVYSPESGRCVGGPCSQGLRAIRVSERDGAVFWHPDETIAPAAPAPALPPGPL